MGSLFRSVMNLVIVLIVLQYLVKCSEASPIDSKPSSLVPTSKSSKLEPAGSQKIVPALLPETKPKNEDEILDTADFVFRPLFVYRQQQAKKRRIYENRRKEIRRNDPPLYYPYGYPSYGYPYYRPIRNRPKKKPVRKEYEFPALF